MADKSGPVNSALATLCSGLMLDPLPDTLPRDNTVAHAPVRTPDLSFDEETVAVENALRYFPSYHHELLASEFAIELRTYGHIYMYRFRPNYVQMRAYPIYEYPAKCREAAAIMHMIMNNLDPRVAQFPHELVTYGGNGQVFANWAQFLLTMHYLSEMTSDQTLTMYSGHPMGLYPSSPSSPRMVVTNGMVIPNYSSRSQYDKMFAMGVSLYGQMTAGSFCYIGPQGIVHGTTLTILNAARKHLKTNDLAGKVFLSAGLGGMSGAQAKAAVICRCVGVIAEVSEEALMKRHQQGWVMEVVDDLDNLVALLSHARRRKKPLSIGYHGNVVDVWERLVVEYESTGELLVDLSSDQTSCHNPFQGGYYPVQLKYQDAQDMMHQDPDKFKTLVKESLCRQVKAINKLASRGMFFFDYGNAFLLEASRAGADVGRRDSRGGTSFRFPSYVQDIMGDIFSMGFGPFRWVCTSGNPTDLATTDKIAGRVIAELAKKQVPSGVRQQFEDNMKWITEAAQHEMVVGSQARILYSDQQGRVALATEFNKAVAAGEIQAPVVISRDHHDVSGTDSPFRETSNIYDGSAFCADMAVQNVIGDSFRGATWVAIHNGGGCGWGEVINGGFGLVLDGTREAEDRARQMLNWDVSNGVSRRCWAGNENAREAITRTMTSNPKLRVTLPNRVQDNSLLERALNPSF